MQLKVALLVLLFVLPLIVIAAPTPLTEELNVTSCSGGNSCSTAEYSANNTNVAHTIAQGNPGKADSWTNPSYPGYAVTSAILRFRHTGDVGIVSSWDLSFWDEGERTKYCTLTPAHSSSDVYTELSLTSCSFDYNTLTDLRLISTMSTSQPGAQKAYIEYATILVTYDPCQYSGIGNWLIQGSAACTLSSNVNLLGNNITVNGTGTIIVTGNITNWTMLTVQGGATVISRNGGGFRR